MKITEIVSENDLTSIKKFGIYKISYKDRIYIGSTTKSFYLRWIQHISDLKKKKHGNSKLSNIVNKYGIEILCFEIIEIVEDKSKVLEREQYYIDLYNSYLNGLNCSPSASNTQGCKRTLESLQKHYYETLSQYDKDGNHIKTFSSLKEASQETNTNYVTLSNACNNKIRLANGFQWRKGKNKDNIGKVKSKGETTIYQYDSDWVFVKEWNSLKDVALALNKARNTISTAVSRQTLINGFYLTKTKIENE